MPHPHHAAQSSHLKFILHIHTEIQRTSSILLHDHDPHMTLRRGHYLKTWATTEVA